MKLVIAVVQDKDAVQLSKALNKAEIQSTRLATTGNFLKSGNSTFLIGIEDAKLDDLLAIIKSHSKTRHEIMSTAISTSMLGELPERPVEVAVGGATVFILPMDKLVHF